MSEQYTTPQIIAALVGASNELSARKEEINKLNVFPVPDGDTGTNMSLTLESVVSHVMQAKQDDVAALRKALINGALMGARGNSGVITSQILRGLCEGFAHAGTFNTEALEKAFAHAQDVAFKAVRKPVRGTILTVLEDLALAAKQARKKKLGLNEALDALVAEGYASVARTPEYLAVLKEHGVVDAGGFGLAILLDGFVASLLGRKQVSVQFGVSGEAKEHSKAEIELIDDWEGSEFRYCTEFLVLSDTLDIEEGAEFLTTMGDCDLLVGTHPNFKVHVHTNTPDKVLAYMLERGQISEVHIHNMDLQSQERNQKLALEQAHASQKSAKEYGIVAVAVGEGNAKILKSLGVDVVVMGGQTMNPSTKDLLDAALAANAKQAIILPNNKNIILAAQSAAEVSSIPLGVVPTKSIPESFAALLSFNAEEDLSLNIEAMTEAAKQVKTLEITYAIKDSKDSAGNPIKTGDVIGIAQGSIDLVGSDLVDLALEGLNKLEADDMDTLTILAGEGISYEAVESLKSRAEDLFEDLEIDVHVGGQALYPLILALE